MEINLKALKAVALFCSKEERRYYLRGVHIQFQSDCLIFEATNGHYLTMLRQKLNENLNHVPGNVIVPISLIDRIKLDKKSCYAELTIENDKITITHMGASYSENRIDGVFPDTKRIAPETTSGEVAQFDAQYPALYKKAAKMFGQSEVSISHNGQSPALVHWLTADSTIEAFGVLMPMRTSSPMQVSPSWARYAQSNAA